MAGVFAFFTLFDLSLTFFRPEVPFKLKIKLLVLSSGPPVPEAIPLIFSALKMGKVFKSNT